MRRACSMRNSARRLPESVSEIAEVVGREKALALIGSLPQAGSRSWRVCLYVPKQLTTIEHPLVRSLGWNDANRLVWAFSGMILQPSNCRFLARELRLRVVWQMSRDGHSLAEIAQGVDLSQARVREILAGKPPEDEGGQ